MFSKSNNVPDAKPLFEVSAAYEDSTKLVFALYPDKSNSWNLVVSGYDITVGNPFLSAMKAMKLNIDEKQGYCSKDNKHNAIYETHISIPDKDKLVLVGNAIDKLYFGGKDEVSKEVNALTSRKIQP